MSPRRAKRSPVWLPLIVLVASFAVFVSTRYVGSGDTVPAELLPIRLLEDRTLTFDGVPEAAKGLPYYLAHGRGAIVSNYPIVPGLLNVPAYAVAKALGMPLRENRFLLSGITASILASLSTLFLFLALRRVTKHASTSLLFAGAYALATCVWAVAARGLWQHGPSAFFLAAALAVLTRRGRYEWTAGFLLGMAVWTRPTDIVFAVALAAYVATARPRRTLAFFLLAAAVPAALLALYSHVYLGSVFLLGQGQTIRQFNGSFVPGLAGLLVSPSRGIVVFSPFLLFAVPSIAGAMRRPSRKEPWTCLAWSLPAFLAVYARWGMWWGGWSFGYRLLIDAVPFLVVFAALAYERHVLRSRVLLVLFWIALAWSFAVQLLGALYYQCGFNFAPTDIDHDLGRLWSVTDGEITRCARIAIGLRHRP